MLLLLHGAAGGWDELAIAVAALAVLWIAVKLAGRKSAGDEDEDELEGQSESAEDALKPASDFSEHQDPAETSSTTRR
jgi:hypothetical protein